MSSRPDLTALEILVLVAETGSLGAAARRVGMAQPNASRALARLERQLGLTLVVRTPAGSRVTTEGEVVTAWAREALGAMDRMILGARSLAAEQAAHLTVAASLTIAEYLAPRWLARFRRAHTDLHVSLAVGNSGEVLEQLAARKIPLGFVETPTVPRTVASTTVARDELVVVVGTSHPWARRRTPVEPGELIAAELVLREVGSGTRDTLVRALERSGTPLAATSMELASTVAVKAAAVEGSAVAVLSELAVTAELATGQLVAVPVQGLDLTRSLRAVWLPERRPEGTAAELIRIAKASK
ncbi:LysR family transcriptional regulator [Paenarthrobacter ureafaciens]|jgi:DNA-binding transcriptional LysR family regulator|uniref:LysR family transcriptional regulator n=1 Tax=Paenarthrobacter TaxID=1742992 RepID=UPI001916E870|nr:MULTISPECIES: LysR family transcriptional regulator [Paenarthrobacter]MBN9128981.1 LysR family transcriptional regulator [Paenarthrobacter ureafaciens]MCW3767058.1 LysR family transcriptional regulator [Paenarthrobacter sp. PAE-2]QQQ62856.1 LysR family transcriptional regulator [Paenarthrobacter ureafaciens]